MSHVIPDFIYKAIVKQTPYEIFGDGEQVRTFTHARDVSDALLAILASGTKNDDFNICGNSTEKISDLAAKIWAHVNPGVPFPPVKAMPVPPADVRFRIGMSDKLSRTIGWKPKHEIDFIIDDTYKFVASSLRARQAS
jgi:nucleoside-diphosphate-sugar epimerase